MNNQSIYQQQYVQQQSAQVPQQSFITPPGVNITPQSSFDGNKPITPQASFNTQQPQPQQAIPTTQAYNAKKSVDNGEGGTDDEELMPFFITCIIVGICGLALICITVYIFAAYPVLHDLGVVFCLGFFPSLAPAWTFGIISPAFLGTIQILLSLIGICTSRMANKWQEATIADTLGHYFKSDKVAKLPLKCESRKTYLRIMFAVILLQLLYVSILLVLLNGSVERAVSSDAIEPGSFVEQVVNYQSALFNECCAAKGWTEQGLVEECLPDGGSLDCDLPDSLKGFKDQLCPCYTKAEENLFNEHVQYAKDSEVCSLMAKAEVVIIPTDTIPTTQIPLSTLVEAEIVNVVGDSADGIDGCGAGYARGLQYAMVKWAVQSFTPYAYVILVISGLQIFTLMMGTVVTCSRKVEDIEDTNLYNQGLNEEQIREKNLKKMMTKKERLLYEQQQQHFKNYQNKQKQEMQQLAILRTGSNNSANDSQISTAGPPLAPPPGLGGNPTYNPGTQKKSSYNSSWNIGIKSPFSRTSGDSHKNRSLEADNINISPISSPPI
jgi:hypothetical protein